VLYIPSQIFANHLWSGNLNGNADPLPNWLTMGRFHPCASMVTFSIARAHARPGCCVAMILKATEHCRKRAGCWCSLVLCYSGFSPRLSFGRLVASYYAQLHRLHYMKALRTLDSTPNE
jgi:hypothetical protein